MHGAMTSRCLLGATIGPQSTQITQSLNPASPVGSGSAVEQVRGKHEVH
jgi:hypothetical protein